MGVSQCSNPFFILFFLSFKEDRLSGLSGHWSFMQGYYEICGALGHCVSLCEAEVQHSSNGISVFGIAGTAKPNINYMSTVRHSGG